jgi:hypothetical protein
MTELSEVALDPNAAAALAATTSVDTRARSRAEQWAPLATGLLLALPVLLFDYPPMSDLPLHEATVGILRHFGDASMFPDGLYFRNLGHPNQLFHAAALLLSLVMRTEVACKIVVAAAVAGLPVAAARLATHLGASRWTAVIVAPVALGWLFFMGLVANLVGLALLLAVLPALDRFVQRPSVKGALQGLGLAVVLYLAHEAVMFVYAGAALLFALAYPLRGRDALLRLAVFAGCVVLAVAQLAYQAPLLARSLVATPTVWMPLGQKLVGMPGALFGAYDLMESRVLFTLTALAVAALGVERWRAREPGASRVEATGGGGRMAGARALLHAYRFEAFAASCMLAYLAYPVTLNGATYVYHRFLPPAFALGAIALAPRGRRPVDRPRRLHPLTTFLAMVLPLASLLIVLPAFAEESQNYRDVVRLSPHVTKGSAVMILAGTARTHGYVRATMGNRIVAERGGRSLFSFSESPIAPVMVRPAARWSEALSRIIPDNNRLCPAHDFKRFKYLMFHTNDVQLEYLMAQSLRPEARLVDVAGEWALFESTLDVVPLTAHDVRAPDPCPGDTLGVRLGKSAADLRRMTDTEAH